MKQAFTLVELIFVIVFEVLSTMAIPQFFKLIINTKISTELFIAFSVQAALKAMHGDRVWKRPLLVLQKE